LRLEQQLPEELAAPAEGGLDDAAIQAMIDARADAKKRRDFAEADRVRNILAESGVVLEDSSSGTVWRRR
jgi:cysteinyl-tRNA synthetase